MHSLAGNFIDYFILCVSVLPDVNVRSSLCTWYMRSEDDVGSSGTGVTDNGESLCDCREWNPGFLVRVTSVLNC